MSDTQEIVQRLEREMADRAAAVEKVDAFKNQLAQAVKAFMAATRQFAASTTMTARSTPKLQLPLTSTFEQSTDCAASASTVDSARSIPLRSTRPLHGHGSKVKEGRTRSSSRTIGVRPDTSVRPFLSGFCNSRSYRNRCKTPCFNYGEFQSDATDESWIRFRPLEVDNVV